MGLGFRLSGSGFQGAYKSERSLRAPVTRSLTPITRTLLGKDLPDSHKSLVRFWTVVLPTSLNPKT